MNHRGLDEILPKVGERITNVPYHIAIIILLYFTKRCFSSLYYTHTLTHTLYPNNYKIKGIYKQ